MSLPVEKHRYTIEEYVRLERDAVDKHEFHEGEILAMSGGTVAHSLITMNVGSSLHRRLQGKRCRTYDSNLRVRMHGTERYVYPDVTIICGPPQFDPDDSTGESIVNPSVIVEVLSPSTASYDRTIKFDWYRRTPSLTEYVMVSQDSPRIEVFRRESEQTWALEVSLGPEASARIPSIDVTLPLSEVYAGVEFPPPSPEPSPSPAKR